MKANQINTISNVPLKTVYVDVMKEDGSFYAQLPMSYNLLWGVTNEKAREYALQQLPSLRGRKIKVAIVQNRNRFKN